MRIEVDYSGLIKRLKKLKGKAKEARAGIFDDKELAIIAKANENGTESIPPRPFMKNAQNKNKAKWKKGFKSMIKGGIGVDAALDFVGQQMRNDIIKSIDSNTPPPNDEKTIKRKKSSKTLIDTGRLRQAIQSEVV